MGDTLVLNLDGQPLSVLPLSKIPWQEAMKLWCSEKVHIMEYYDDWEVHTSTQTFKVPSVVMVKKYVRRKTKINVSRNNVFIRDMFTCQYCNSIFPRKQLTIDHVVPSSKGGTFSWENLVAACYLCNNRKGDKIMKPINTPREPSYYELIKDIKL